MSDFKRYNQLTLPEVPHSHTTRLSSYNQASLFQVADFGSARWIQNLEETQDISTASTSFGRSMTESAKPTIKGKKVQIDFVRESTPLLVADALMSSDVGTLAWSAPEVLGGCNAYGAAADVFR